VLFFSYFNQISIFWTDFSKNAQAQNFVNILPLAAELFHADGRTDREIDMTKVIITFRNFSNLQQKKMNILDGAGVWSMYTGVHVQMLCEGYKHIFCTLFI